LQFRRGQEAARAALPLDEADQFRVADLAGDGGGPVVEAGREPPPAGHVGDHPEAGHVLGVLPAGAEPVDRVDGAQAHQRPHGW